ncbi:hypothetical protein OIO90_004035 [Microbotryomycetes sp. JL221]|nr:hypothetical protein OIO90_004035 [Microbotryomycetes sp. JL221]
MLDTPRANSASIPKAPAPWQLHGQGWVFLSHTPFSEQPVPLPTGSYSPFEQGTSSDLTKRFHGGTGAVMIVRYDTSPVGPYDELLFIPGYFSFTDENKQTQYHMTVTRIYVSTPASVKNGRGNWSIPKHIAKFNFTPVAGDRHATRITIAQPSSSSKPFFRAIVKDSRLTPFSFPISTSLIETGFVRRLTKDFEFQLVQPPLSDLTEVQDASMKATAAGEELSWLVPSSTTSIVKPTSSGRAKLCHILLDKQAETDEQSWDGFGDGKPDGFPRFKPIMGGRGSHMVSFDMTFPVPVALSAHQLS